MKAKQGFQRLAKASVCHQDRGYRGLVSLGGPCQHLGSASRRAVVVVSIAGLRDPQRHSEACSSTGNPCRVPVNCFPPTAEKVAVELLSWSLSEAADLHSHPGHKGPNWDSGAAGGREFWGDCWTLQCVDGRSLVHEVAKCSDWNLLMAAARVGGLLPMPMSDGPH